MQIIQNLRTQTEIVANLKGTMRDSEQNRWTTVEIYQGINHAIDRWGERVKVPFLYSIVDGWQSNLYEYALPWYVTPPLEVQQRRYSGLNVGSLQIDLDQGASTWIDVTSWDVEPDGLGGYKLRLGTLPYNVDGRIIWWAKQGRIPTSVLTLESAVGTTTATSLTITGTPTIGNAGFIKIDDELIAYAGYTQAGGITTLLNLLRGVNGSTAATHLDNAPVNWCIAVHRPDLYVQLEDQTAAYLYGLFLTDASPQEIQHHTFQMRYRQQMADEFWKRYTPLRQTKMRLGMTATGSRR